MTQPKIRASPNSKVLVTVISNGQTNIKNSVQSSQSADNKNLTNAKERVPMTANTQKVAKVQEGQNKDKISMGPKRTEAAVPGTTNTQSSKNQAKSPVISNKVKTSTEISTSSDSGQLASAKRSSSNLPTVGTNKEQVSSGITCKKSPPETRSDGDQSSQKNKQNSIGPHPNYEESLNSKSKEATSRVNLLSPNLDVSNPLSKIKNSTSKSNSSSSLDNNQKTLKEKSNTPCLALSQKPATLSSTDLKQKDRAQGEGCETCSVGKQNTPSLPKVNPEQFEEYRKQQLKNPVSLHLQQSKDSLQVNLRKDQRILKSQGLDNAPVKQSDQHVSKSRQAVNQDKGPKSVAGQELSQHDATQTRTLNVLKVKPTAQCSTKKLLKTDQNTLTNQISGTDTQNGSLKSELNSKNKYSSESKSSNSSQEPLNQHSKGNFQKENCKRILAPKDHSCITKKSGSEHSFTLPDSIENKKEFSVVTRDTFCLPTKNTQRSKSDNGEILTDASESSDSEIRKLTNVNSSSRPSSSLMLEGKQMVQSRGVEKKQAEVASHSSVSQNAKLVIRDSPRNISRASQNSFDCNLPQTNGDINSTSSSEEGLGQNIGGRNDSLDSRKMHSVNARLADEAKKKVSPFTYIVKVNQEETNVFYNVEATDYTVSTIRKHYAKSNPVNLPGKDIGSPRNDLGNKAQNCSSPLLDQTQFNKGTHDVMGGASVSNVQITEAGSCNQTTTPSVSLQHTKALRSSSQSSSSVSSSLLSSSLSSSSSPPRQCQQSDDIPNQGLPKILAANIPKTESDRKCDSLPGQETRALSQPLSSKSSSRLQEETLESEGSTNHPFNLNQDLRLMPDDCKNLLTNKNNQRPKTLPLSVGGPELRTQQLPRVSGNPQNLKDYKLQKINNGTWPKVTKSSNGEYLHHTNQCALITNSEISNKISKLPPGLIDHNFALYNPQQQKQSKVLTRCVSDSAISSDLTDIDSSNLSPQPSHLPSWFSAQHINCYKDRGRNDRIYLPRVPFGSKIKVPSNAQTSLKTFNQHEYVESLSKLKPFSYSRSLSLDGLNQWIITKDKLMLSGKIFEPATHDYPSNTNYLSDRYLPLTTRGEVSESDDPSNNLDKRNKVGVKDKGIEIRYQPQFQDDSQRDPPSSLDSSSSPSSASPYMVRCKNDGSLLNLSQEEFNNLEQNLPSDISSLVSSFDGCYLGQDQASLGKESYALRDDNAKSLGFSSDDAVVLNCNQRQKPARIPLRLALRRLSSSGEPLEVDNIEDRVLRNLRPTKAAGQRDWTSTADSDETLYDYFNMPTYPPEENGRENQPESDSDISDFQRPPEHFRRPRAKNNLPMYHSSKSASVTDLPGDYPTSTSSCWTGSPSLSSEMPCDLIDEEEESLKYISIGIQASQTECATQTEDMGTSPSDFTMPKHSNILKDSVASNMIPFPFNIPYLMAEASAGTFHTLPALMIETTNLLKNLSKQLTVEPSATGSSPDSMNGKCSHKCSVTTQTDLAQQRKQPEIVSPSPLPQPSGMCSSSYCSTPSSTHYPSNYQLDHGSSLYPSQRSHPEINIHQNNFHPGMNINHDLMHTQNYINPRLTPNPVSSNTYTFPYHPQQSEVHGSLPNRRDMHLPLGNDTGTLKSNCSMGDFWKGDMCDSFTYIPQHQTLPKDEMPSPGQKPFSGFGHGTRMSPHDQTPNLHANRIHTPLDGNTGQFQNCQLPPNCDNSANRYNRQFKFNQTSPLPASNYDKFYHSMKYTSPNSRKQHWNDLINYSEYNLDSTARDVHFQPDWRMTRGDYLPADQRGSLQKPHEHDMSASAPDRFQAGIFDSHTPKPRFRSMTMDCSGRSHLRPETLYNPSFQRSSTLPHSGLASLGPNGDNLVPPRDFSHANHFSSTPRLHQQSRPRAGGIFDAASYAGGDNQLDHYLSEDLNISLKKSGLTDEYLQLLNKSARSLPKMESTIPVSEGHTRDPKTYKILVEASKLLNTNSNHSQILSEMHETKSYPESVGGVAFCGVDHLDGTLNSASSIDQSQNNELRSVLKINEQYANMIASDGKPTADTSKNSTIRHKSKSQKRQALHNQFKEWEKEQLDIMDMVNLKYLPVSFTVKYLEKKVNHCIAQTDLLLDSLDDEEPTTTTSAVSEGNSTTTMDEDVFESSSASNLRHSGLSMDYFQLPRQQENSHKKSHSFSNSSLLEAGFDTRSELSPNTWLQLQSSVPNLLTDDAATDGDVSWTDEMGYIHQETDRQIDTLTYTKSSVVSSMTDISLDNSDQTISEGQDISSQGSLGQDAMSMLEEVSQFRKFYSAEIEKIRDGLTEMDVRVSAHHR